MSFYVKLLILVIVGSVATHYGINTLLLSTDHMPERFSSDTLAYSQAKRMEAARNAQVTEEAEEKLIAALDEAEEESTSGKRKTPSNTRVVNQKVPIQASEDEQAQEEKQTVAKEEQTAEPEVEIPFAEGEDGDDLDQLAFLNANRSSASSEASRSDSDADMQSNETDESKITKAKKPDTRIDRSTLKKEDTNTKKRKNTVQALDLAYALPDNATCVIPGDGLVRVGVHYRQASFAIKGESLTNIDKLINLYKKCNGGTLLILQNADGLSDTDDRIVQLRKDEIKYYLLQRRVPKADMIFPDN